MASTAGWGSVSCQRLTENIIVLGILTNQQAGQPLENTIPRETKPTRQLPIQREQDLAHVLAILSATRDDPKRVMAVALEEHASKKSMTIKIAGNTGDLSEVKEGFKGIARILEQVSTRNQSPSMAKELLLQQIVVMDEARILSRLYIDHKYSHQWKKGKLFPFTRLREIFSAASTNSLPPESSQVARGILSRLADIRSLHGEISRNVGNKKMKSSMHTSIMKLFKLCDSLTAQIHSAPMLVRKASHDDKLILEKLKKLGRYCSISLDLVSAARNSKYDVFNHIKVETVKISPSCASKPKCSTSLVDSLENACGSAKTKESQKAKKLVSSFVQSPSGRDMFNKRQADFKEGLSRVPKTWKVHAEIQLLLHYELHPNLQKPRVICSSKDACYLCNLFIKAHCLYHVPKTHGKLYDTWCFPDLKANLEPDIKLNKKPLRMLNGVVERFNSSLEEKIRSILSGAKFFYQLGNVESTLLPYVPWSTSVLSQGSHGPSLVTALTACNIPTELQRTASLERSHKLVTDTLGPSAKAAIQQAEDMGHQDQPVVSQPSAREISNTCRDLEVKATSSTLRDAIIAELPEETSVQVSQENADKVGFHSRQKIGDEMQTRSPQAMPPVYNDGIQATNSPTCPSPIDLQDDLSAPSPQEQPSSSITPLKDPSRPEAKLTPPDPTPSPPRMTPNTPKSIDTVQEENAIEVEVLKDNTTSSWYALSTPNARLMFKTRNLHLDISQIWDSQISRTAWVQARLLGPNEMDLKEVRDAIKVVDLPRNKGITVTHGSALSQQMLYISLGGDVIAIKYNYENM